jgi:hypothetical protein
MKTTEQTKQKLAQWLAETHPKSQYGAGFRIGYITALEWILEEKKQ